MIIRRLPATTLACLTLAAAFAPPALAGTASAEAGLDDLIARLGAAAPTGDGVVVAQVESGEAFYPGQTDPEFTGKTFVLESGASGASFHATEVGKLIYGQTSSLAPGIDTIHAYGTADWVLSGFLRATSAGVFPPLATPGGAKIVNNSWVACLGPGDGSCDKPANNDANRRADFVVLRDDVLMASGVQNFGMPNVPLMSHMYNGLAVGVRQADHTTDDTLGDFDGPGRLIPHVVGPSDSTSGGTGLVSSALALMVETARTDAALASNPNAERSEVIKAAILAGAVHENMATGTWSNEPVTSGPTRGVTARPIDAVVGAGTVNVDRSHMILTGGEQDGSTTPPASATIDRLGWDLMTVPIAGSVYHRFTICDVGAEVSILATWHRYVSGPSTWTRLVANFDLELWRVAPDGTLESLVGDDGLGVFAAGNVRSESGVDNVEHLYLTDLAPGAYVIEVRRLDAHATIPDWDLALAWMLPDAPSLPEDLNGDCSVGFFDLNQMLTAWGPCPVGPPCPADLNDDGSVGFIDLNLLLAAWGS